MKTKSPPFLQRLTAPTLVVTSVVLALAAPTATVNAVTAQFSLQSSLSALKQRVETAIDNSLTRLQQSSDSLNFTLNVSADQQNGLSVQTSGPGGTASGTVSKTGASGSVTTSRGSSASGSIDKTGASGTVTEPNGSNASGSVSSSGASGQAQGPNGSSLAINLKDFNFSGTVSVPKELKQKLQAANQKAIDRLKSLKTEVNATVDVQDLKAKAKEFDQQFKEVATATVQASVTKSIDSMTQVLDRLQVAANALQSQVTKLKDCIQKGSVQADADSNSASVNIKAPTCAELNLDVNSGDAGASLQAKLDEIHSTLETIRSFLTNSIGLVAHLKDNNFTGTLTSFKGISAQIDIVANLSGNAQNDLLNLSAAVNKS